MSSPGKKKIVVLSLSVTVLLIAIKVSVAYLTNSIGVYSEVLNNSLDFVSVFITYLAIRMAVRPADKDHTYGHGKYENLSALIEVIIITILGIFIIVESVKRIIDRRILGEVQWYVYLILSIAVLINIIRVIYIGKAAKEYDSIALKSNFLNYTGDIFSSIIVIVGLLLSNLGIYIADPIASIIVSLIVLGFGIKLGISTIRNLLDYIPKDITEQVSGLVMTIPEIKKIDELKIHEVGNIKFINLLVSLPQNLAMTQVENIKGKIRKKVKSDFNDSNLIIETRLLEENLPLAEKIKEQFLNINKIKDIHNINIYRIGNSIDISIHIEFQEDLNLEESEKLTKKVEDILKRSIPDIRRIYVHLEEEKMQQDWKDVTSSSTGLISNIKEYLPEEIDPDSCHYFTILEKEGSYNVAFHCRVKKDLNIRQAHKIITRTENMIKDNFKDINDISIHAEPRKR
jgi:cation diffusion facilitator family transporter